MVWLTALSLDRQADIKHHHPALARLVPDHLGIAVARAIFLTTGFLAYFVQVLPLSLL